MAICLECFRLCCVAQCSDFSTWCLFILCALTLLFKERPRSIKGDQNHYKNFVAVSRNQPYGVSLALCSQNGEWFTRKSVGQRSVEKWIDKLNIFFTRKTALLFYVIKVTCTHSKNVEQYKLYKEIVKTTYYNSLPSHIRENIC